MIARSRGYSGLAYLAKATDFLTACRRADLLGGLWDVADVQWWWRDDDFSDPDRQRFFNAPDGSTVAMLLLCSHPPTFDYEFLPGVEHTDVGRHVFKTGLNWLENMHDAATTALASFYVGERHVGLQELAERFGYARAPHVLVQASLELPTAPIGAPLRDGYVVRSIHPTDVTNGRQPVLATPASGIRRLQQTTLYRQQRHMVVADENDHAVAESIVWLDEDRRIGVFEPVATHPQHRGHGLAKAMLAHSLQRLYQDGATIAKVSYAAKNAAASALYRSVGFRPHAARLLYS